MDGYEKIGDDDMLMGEIEVGWKACKCCGFFVVHMMLQLVHSSFTTAAVDSGGRLRKGG